MKIGIYVGSFNPVHKGHIAIAQACIDQSLVDEVWIIPTGSYWEKNDLYPLKDRIAMLKLAAKEAIRIDETYNEYPYTYMIFEQLKKDHPDDVFALILGADNLPRFNEWKHYEELLENEFIVLPRDQIKRKQIVSLMKKMHKEDYRILKLKQIDISSTYIREHLDDREAIADMIDEDVYDYLLNMERK
ncbi:MAG: nicotinate (nicotinamide) nucleotide adenylyltransferase [Erysipelotrichaceae bacterium]|nr:nicotinate (nicotinamide) nucleotide adenylyltransferase [Erysipelotrichaceae bacterium]